MPCLNEAQTLKTGIDMATGFLERSGVSGEILIGDNGSTDGSQKISVSTLGLEVILGGFLLSLSSMRSRRPG